MQNLNLFAIRVKLVETISALKSMFFFVFTLLPSISTYRNFEMIINRKTMKFGATKTIEFKLEILYILCYFLDFSTFSVKIDFKV